MNILMDLDSSYGFKLITDPHPGNFPLDTHPGVVAAEAEEEAEPAEEATEEHKA